MIKQFLLFMVTMILILLISILVTINMGNFLIADHKLVKADAIVVLMGAPKIKIPEAADLYLEGYADLVIMAQTPHGELEPDSETGLLEAGETARSKLILIDLGVPKEDITIIPSMTRSTRDEAIAVRDYLSQRQDINSIILVTSSHHTRRAFIAFSRAFKKLDNKVELISRASKYGEPFNAARWWRDEQAMRLVFLEYMKITNYYFLDYFNIELVDLIDIDIDYFLGINLNIRQGMIITLLCKI